MSWLNREYHGGTPLDWVMTAVVVVALLLVLRYVLARVIEHLRSHATSSAGLEGLLAEVLAETQSLFLLAIGVYLAACYLDLAPTVANHVVIVALLLQAALWGNAAVKWWVEATVNAKRGTDGAGATSVSIIGFIARVVLWSLAVLMILDNLGVDVTALVAGLGIGGIAIALALQNILSDVFASLSITLDQPFVIDDFIIVNQEMGTVEYIGLKTTRIRSLSGEQIIFANTDLLNSRIHNYKRMRERRIQFSFGVIYETPADVLERISGMVREIVEAQPLTRFDRAHFKSYGDFSLDFEVVYFVLTADYNTYMDVQQTINIALFRRFQQEGIAFAYPTRTLYLNPPPMRIGENH